MFTSIGDYRTIDRRCDALIARARLTGQDPDTAKMLRALSAHFPDVSRETLAQRLTCALILAD